MMPMPNNTESTLRDLGKLVERADVIRYGADGVLKASNPPPQLLDLDHGP